MAAPSARARTAPVRPGGPALPGGEERAAPAVFLLLRRMRLPLMVLVLVFAISVLGLTLVPGQDAEGQPDRLSFFEAFYFMSYTATTIGFGELPYTFSDAQRLWVIVCIYSTVVAWAYAIGALLTILQDRAFRDALALQHFSRKVQRMGEPFLLLAGYGQTGELLARSFDALGRRMVVLDISPERIDALDQGALRGDVPGLVADARSPASLRVAGLANPHCEGVLAITDDDEVNLAVSMATALLRPELPVVARTILPAVARRMQAFGTPIVVNPFDRFGEHVLLGLGAPSSFQLMTWLEGGPGADLPDIGRRPRPGVWVVCGYGRFGRALVADLRRAQVDVTVVEPDPSAQSLARNDGVRLVEGDGSDPVVLEAADLRSAVGLVSGTSNDTTNLSIVAAARRVNPRLFLIGRQNDPAYAPLHAAMELDALLVPTELVAQEAYAHLSTPLLWRFLQLMPAQGDAWASDLVAQLVERCGERLPAVWRLQLSRAEAPALQRWLPEGAVRAGDLLRHPEARDRELPALILLVQRGDESFLTPGPDLVLAPGDRLLLAGRPEARWALDNTLEVDASSEYVVTGQRRAVGWLWRRLSGATRTPRADDVDSRAPSAT
jgi:Trk K+ transport system NAD-binding subunit